MYRLFCTKEGRSYAVGGNEKEKVEAEKKKGV